MELTLNQSVAKEKFWENEKWLSETFFPDYDSNPTLYMQLFEELCQYDNYCIEKTSNAFVVTPVNPESDEFPAGAADTVGEAICIAWLEMKKQLTQ